MSAVLRERAFDRYSIAEALAREVEGYWLALGSDERARYLRLADLVCDEFDASLDGAYEEGFMDGREEDSECGCGHPMGNYPFAGGR